MARIVKLQRVKTREKDGKEYYKYQITIPKKLVEAFGWDPGDELEAKVGDRGIELVPEEEEDGE